MLKNLQLKTRTDRDKNLKRLLGLERPELKVLERSFGLVKRKGKFRTSPVAYQRKIRQEWEKRLKRQSDISRRKRPA